VAQNCFPKSFFQRRKEILKPILKVSFFKLNISLIKYLFFFISFFSMQKKKETKQRKKKTRAGGALLWVLPMRSGGIFRIRNKANVAKFFRVSNQIFVELIESLSKSFTISPNVPSVCQFIAKAKKVHAVCTIQKFFPAPSKHPQEPCFYSLMYDFRDSQNHPKFKKFP